MKFPNISFVILAGGKNSRFNGKNKAFIAIENEKIFDKILAIARNISDEIIVVTNHPEEYAEYKDILLAGDLIRDIGPIGGIYTALSKSSKQAVFVVACDMPYLREDIITNQITSFFSGNADILIPRINNFIEPLHTIYSKRILPQIESFILTKKEFKILRFLTEVKTNFWEIENTMDFKRCFTNINSAEDLSRVGGVRE